MAVHDTRFTANAQQNFIIPWTDQQLYMRSNLWRFVDDRTSELMSRGFPLAKGLEFTRDDTTGYFTALADSASNAPYMDRGGSTEKVTLETETDKNLDLVFDYSGEEINALTQLGVWSDRQLGRLNELRSTRDGKVYAALVNNKTGAQKASNKRNLPIADAAKFLEDPEDATARSERFKLVSYLANAQIRLWGRGLELENIEPDQGSPGYMRPVHLLNEEAVIALNTWALSDAKNGGTGFIFDNELKMGMLNTPVGGSMVVLDHHMDNTLTAAGDELLAITFVPKAVKGVFPLRDTIPESLKYVDGNPTPIRVIGQRYAYAVELFDENLVLSLDSTVTADGG